MRKLFKHIGMICLALAVAVGSFFVPIGKSNNISSNAVSNDSSELGYQFDGSEILFFETFINANEQSTPRFLSFDISIITTLVDGISIDFGASQFSYSGSSPFPVNAYYPYDPLTQTASRWFTRDNFDDGYSIKVVSASDYNFYLPIYLKTDSGFIANCKAVRIYVSAIGTYLGDNFNPSSSNYTSNVINIEYIDFNDNTLLIQFLSPSYFSDLYEDRTYYFLNNFTDNDYYQQGYHQGLIDNQQSIYNSGYSAGFDIGYDRGVISGASDANEYSFISLFGAIFDAPITMLTGLLNFEFLGIDLWAFITSLFTLALVLYIVKLVMGR